MRDVAEKDFHGFFFFKHILKEKIKNVVIKTGKVVFGKL